MSFSKWIIYVCILIRSGAIFVFAFFACAVVYKILIPPADFSETTQGANTILRISVVAIPAVISLVDSVFQVRKITPK